jgi:tetratricopeptide (TPR) repeat protein
MMDFELKDHRKRKILLAAGLLAATLIAYQSLKENQFVSYDDEPYITENYRVRAGLSWKNVAWAFTSTEAANWHPLTWLSHMADCSVYGLNPAGHHWTSLLIHLANVVILFLLLERLTRALWRSAFVAALFAVHPINVESVAWAAERKNLLCTLFWLLAIWAYAWYAAKPQWRRYLAVAAFFILGLLSKPMVVSLPCVLLLLDYWPLMRLAPRSETVKTIEPSLDNHEGPAKAESPVRPSIFQLVLEKVPLFLIAAVSSVVTVSAQRSGGAIASSDILPLATRIANGVAAYAGYIYKTIWPTQLAVFYPHPRSSLSWWQIASSALLLIAVSAIVVWRGTERRYLLVGWLWYLGTLLPVIGLIQVGGQGSADRYLYIPMIGLLIMAVWSVADWAGGIRLRIYVSLALGACVVIALVLDTRRQLTYWRDSISLFGHALSVTRNNYIAHNNLGTALARAGNLEAAMQEYRLSIAAKPDHHSAYLNMASALDQEGKTEDAIVAFNRALAPGVSKADAATAHFNLGAIMTKRGDFAAAQDHYLQAIHLDSNNFRAYTNLGNLLFLSGDLEGAIANYSHAYDISPNAVSCSNLGLAYQRQGKPLEALRLFREGLSLEPNNEMLKQKLRNLLEQSNP